MDRPVPVLSPFIDSHVHFADSNRLPELTDYLAVGVPPTDIPPVGQPGARPAIPHASGPFTRSGLISLPVAAYRNFNPELIEAKTALPDIVDMFASFDHWSSSGSSRTNLADQVREFAAIGFGGLKLWEGKPDLQQELGATLDSPAYLAAYEAATEAAMPILIHVADPPSFWHRSGGPWSYRNRTVPSFEELQRQAAAVCETVPGARFIFPHLLFLADDLPSMQRFLDRHPNAWMDLAPGHYFFAPLGQKRAAARRFFSEYRERIIFGTDAMFFPASVSGLPNLTLEETSCRARRLRDFLATDREFDNPFTLSRDEVPVIRGLALDADTLAMITAGTYVGLMGRVPRPLDAVRASRYVSGFASVRALGESPS